MTKKPRDLNESIRRASTELRRKQLLRNEGSDPDIPAPVVERRLCPEAPSLTGTLQPAVPGDGTSFTHSRRRPVARGRGGRLPVTF